jgi:hypothetical protein
VRTVGDALIADDVAHGEVHRSRAAAHEILVILSHRAITNTLPTQRTHLYCEFESLQVLVYVG